MNRFLATMLSGVVLSSMSHSVLAADLEKVRVAYFKEWPTANQVAQSEKWYDESLGVEIEWLVYETGKAMADAMVAGDVDMAYSMGLVPFTVAVSDGAPIRAVGVSVSYAENDNCVVNSRAAIDKANAHELQGKKVAVPFGTVSHYKMLRTLRHLGVDTQKVDILDMIPSAGAEALASGEVTMACGWGGPLWRMKKHGYVLMTATEQEKLGIRVFDVVAVTDDFAANHGDLVTKFLEVTDRAAEYLDDEPEDAKPIIAAAAGMKLKDSNIVLSLFEFPTREAQLSASWMHGTVQAFTKEVARFFVEQGQMEAALDDYGAAIDPSFYEAVSK